MRSDESWRGREGEAARCRGNNRLIETKESGVSAPLVSDICRGGVGELWIGNTCAIVPTIMRYTFIFRFHDNKSFPNT